MSWTPSRCSPLAVRSGERSVAFESLAQAANTGKPQPPLFPSLDAQIASGERKSWPSATTWSATNLRPATPASKHYHDMAMPSYIVPVSFLGVTDDLTGPSRLDQNSVSYKRPPQHKAGLLRTRQRTRYPAPLMIQRRRPRLTTSKWHGALAPPRPHPPPLLRLRIKRRHRLLRRRDDAAGRSLRSPRLE